MEKQQETVVETTQVDSAEPIAAVESKTIANPIAETQDQINWKKFREQREIERKESEAAKKKASEKESEALALKAALEAVLNKNPPVQSDNGSGYQEDESEDHRIQKKVDAALMEREKRYEQERNAREHAEFPQKLNATFSDFTQVCTQENLDYIDYHYPEISAAFKHAPEGFDKWANIYKTVKRFVPNTSNGKDKIKAEKNFNKPQAMTVPGMTPTGDSAPQFLDDKRRSDNWTRMQRVMKGLSS